MNAGRTVPPTQATFWCAIPRSSSRPTRRVSVPRLAAAQSARRRRCPGVPVRRCRRAHRALAGFASIRPLRHRPSARGRASAAALVSGALALSSGARVRRVVETVPTCSCLVQPTLVAVRCLASSLSAASPVALQPLRPTPRLPTNRPTAAARSGCVALLRVVSNSIALLRFRATPRPSTTGPLRQRALRLPLRPTPHLPTGGPTAFTPMDCIARLNIASNLTLLLHFLPINLSTHISRPPAPPVRLLAASDPDGPTPSPHRLQPPRRLRTTS